MFELLGDLRMVSQQTVAGIYQTLTKLAKTQANHVRLNPLFSTPAFASSQATLGVPEALLHRVERAVGARDEDAPIVGEPGEAEVGVLQLNVCRRRSEENSAQTTADEQ